MCISAWCALFEKCVYPLPHAEDLWDALEKASNKPVATVMSTWTKQMGYPVLSVEGKQVRARDHMTLHAVTRQSHDQHVSCA